ncbi:MAG: hypothetical protein AAB473_00885 [Patescibacteria group bacterium]
MIIISAGKAFNDIDAFASALAYRELLAKEGKESLVVFPGPLNHSVTDLAKNQSTDFVIDYQLKDDDRVVYVDLSDPEHFAFGKGSEEQIDELYDHHYGFEDYWKEKLGDRSHIERLGAAATLIWEEFVKRGFPDSISAESANLLSIAILQNTLNFTSTETNDRDRSAFAELKAHRSMPGGWEDQYFRECTEGMAENFNDALRNDTKKIEHLFGASLLVFSQLEITEDPKTFLEMHRTEIPAYWSEFGRAHRLINIADMSSRTSLLFSDDADWLSESLSPLFSSILGRGEGWITVPIHQRKQILKLIQRPQV